MFPIPAGVVHFDTQVMTGDVKFESVWSLGADEDSPSPGGRWLAMSVEHRLRRAEEAVREWLAAAPWPERVKAISVTSTTESGSVFISIDGILEVQYRSEVLLGLESFLKKAVDESLVVWCQPNQDRNALRRLRGVRVNP